MRRIIAVLALFLFVPSVLAECEGAFDLMQITRDTMLCNKGYDVQSGITIKTDNVTLDCNGAIIRGTAMQDGQGIIIDHADGVTVKNCNILNYDVGVYVREGNRNTIIQNALLKNRIGVRMLQSFENRFENNADKSMVKPVSALASKFNSFWLTNKDLDKDFCEVNLCNSPGPMNPCVNDDYYCSPSCNYKNDNDCPAPKEEPVKAVEQKAAEAEQVRLEEAPAPETLDLTTKPKQANSKPIMSTGAYSMSFMGQLPDKARFWTMAVLFVICYIIGFLCFQHHHWKHG
jgi:parallel beta-helix repeat protein